MSRSGPVAGSKDLSPEGALCPFASPGSPVYSKAFARRNSLELQAADFPPLGVNEHEPVRPSGMAAVRECFLGKSNFKVMFLPAHMPLGPFLCFTPYCW